MTVGLANTAMEPTNGAPLVSSYEKVTARAVCGSSQGRSMKGDVKTNISPPTGCPDDRVVVAASPCLRREEMLIQLSAVFGGFITTWCSSETEKRKGRIVADHSSI
jgi:hypothetical protein